MTEMEPKLMTLVMKNFLEMVQPLPVKYGYPRSVKRGPSFVTYQDMGTEMRKSIGSSIISERKTYTITVQTKTAEQNILYSEFIKHGTDGSTIEFLSDDLRRDVTVDDGWINTIILRSYNGFDPEQKIYTAKQVHSLLQQIADSYIFVTSRYATTLEESFIDKLVVPPLEEKLYTYQEMFALKQEYLDRLILTTTEF